MKPGWKEDDTEYMPEMDVQDPIYEDFSEEPKKLNRLFIFIALGILIAAAAYLLSDILSSGSLEVDASNSGSYLDGMKERIFGGNGGEAYWQRTANAFVQQGDYESAVQCYDNLIEINSSSSTAWRDRGYSLLMLGDAKEAAESLGRSTAINPADADAWKAQGDALASLGRDEDALKCYDKALVLSPRSSAVLYSMGMALNSVGRYDDAAKCFDRAIDNGVEPSGDVWKGKGDSMVALGDYEEALLCYENAAMLNSTDGDVLYRKSLVLRSLGRDSDANDSLAAAKTVGGIDLNFSLKEKSAVSASDQKQPSPNPAISSGESVKVSAAPESRAADSMAIEEISISSSSEHSSNKKKYSSSSGSTSSGGTTGSSGSSGSGGSSKSVSVSSGGSGKAVSKSASQSSEKANTGSSLSSHSSMVYSKVSYSEISGAS